MGRSIQFTHHPFRFLLYLEWGLLAMAVINVLSAPAELGRRLLPGPPLGAGPELTVACLVLFGLLGLYLPTRGPARLAHLGLQIVLVVLASGLMLRGVRLFPFVYLVLVIRSCLMVGLGGRIAVTAIAFVLFMTTLGIKFSSLGGRLPRPLRYWVATLHMNLVIFFGLTIMGAQRWIMVGPVLLVNALLTERAVQHRLQQANADLQQSASQREQLATAQERSRIAREIHDSLGHSLTALNIQLEGAMKLAQRNPQKAQTLLAEAKRLGSVALQDVRQSVATLRQPLSSEPLEQQLRRLLDTLEQLTGVVPQVEIDISGPLSQAASLALYRIAQEGITNIIRHAHASTVSFSLTVQETGGATLKLQDNGCGFDLEQTSTGYGLQGIRERAQAASGQLTLVSSRGNGCLLLVEIPANSV